MQKNLRKIFSISIFLIFGTFAANCSSVPNVIGCAEINLSRGVCRFTVSQEKIIIDDENPYKGMTWFDIRRKSLTVPADSWAEIKKWMIKMCKRHKCDVDIASWDRDISADAGFMVENNQTTQDEPDDTL